jgi:hypothetical protein
MRRRDARAAALVLGLAMAAATACATDRSDPAALARLRVLANGEIPPPDGALPVRFQSLDEPQLDRLAAREHLHDLVAAIPRQFDQIRRLQDWVNAQWPDGTPAPYPPWNALSVLDWIRSGKTGGFCAQYAQVFLQSLAALGYTARYIEIGSRDNPYAHYLTEVWSNDYDKWVVMDADFNVHFERGGVPLSALEVHDALVSSRLADVVPVFERARPGHATPATWPLRTAELYAYLRYHLNANHLTRPHDAPFDRFGDMIEFEDPRVPAWEVSPVAATFPKVRLTRRRITDPRVVSAKINQVEIAIHSAAKDRVTLDLRDNVLQRASYQYRVTATGDAPGPWTSIAQPTLVLRMPDAGGVVEVRGVNVRGIAGPPATLAIDPLPARPSAR